MKLQWETDYALRCVLCLVGRDRGWIRVAELAEEMKAPEQMTRKMVTRLCTAGILEGKPGPRGGVRLARSPGQISVYDVVFCVEGDLCINRCLGPDGVCNRNGIPHCTVHGYLKSLQAEMEKSMRSMTFDRLAACGCGTSFEARQNRQIGAVAM